MNTKEFFATNAHEWTRKFYCHENTRMDTKEFSPRMGTNKYKKALLTREKLLLFLILLII
ncbi:MAG: hypothetical protein V9F02_11190 [Chitinophagaceae bacterium]